MSLLRYYRLWSSSSSSSCKRLSKATKTNAILLSRHCCCLEKLSIVSKKSLKYLRTKLCCAVLCSVFVAVGVLPVSFLDWWFLLAFSNAGFVVGLSHSE